MSERYNDHLNDKVAVVRPTRFSVLWLIPLLAVIISAWLAWHHFMTQGPVITLTFDTADGLVPGQTEVKDKAVTLGVVQDVKLSRDLSHADVKVQMSAESADYLTDHSRFWVVRPRINGTSITGLETVLSGAYIALDPGAPGGQPQRHFKGLETPPGVRSDQPGSTFWLVTSQLDSLGAGAPVFYRAVAVGEILGYTMPPGGKGPILLKVFVRAPYDRYLRTDSHFWNVSGVQVGFGAGGLQVRIQSFQALLSGGVAFGGPPNSLEIHTQSAAPNSVFRLYASHEEADNTRYRKRLHVATYVDSSVGSLTRGNKVTSFGLQVGIVTDVKLELGDNEHHMPRVRIDMDIEPERVFSGDYEAEFLKHSTRRGILEELIAEGMRASVQNASFLTGESMVALGFTHRDKPGVISHEGDVVIIPSEAGGMDGILQSVSSIADKISTMPLTQIGDNINSLLGHADNTMKNPEIGRSLRALRGSLQSLNSLLDHTDEHLPAILKNLQDSLANARTLLAAYGGDTDFHRNLQTLVIQLSQMARSVHQMTDYLDRHPSALITGRRN